MKNKKETRTLENNLSNNAMMMDHVLGSAPNPFKNRKDEKMRNQSIPESDSSVVKNEKTWIEEEEEK